MTLGGASWLGIKPPEVEPNPTLPFSQEEVQQILSACDRYEGDKDRMRAFILVMLYSGLRISDTCTLRRDAVRNGKILLRQAKTGQPVYVPVPPCVTEALDRVKGNGECYFWSGKGKVLTIVGNWRKYLLERRGRAVGRMPPTSDLMSFTGIHPLFHTSGEISDNTMSPNALATVRQAVAGAVSKYVGSVG